jgi:peptide/nickel transport system permease protein
MFSRIIYGARISLTVGLIGIAISFIIGIVIGGIAGYYGGWIDNVGPAHDRGDPLASRICRCGWRCPPRCRSPGARCWSISASPSSSACSTGPGLARAVRSKLLALREEDFARRAS